MTLFQAENFTLKQAEEKLRQHITQIPYLQKADIAHVPNLDILDLYAFSIMPSIGLPGEVIYLVSKTEILISGEPKDFNKLMQRLEIGQGKNKMDAHKFAHLFLRLCAIRRGDILDSPDGHVLLHPGQLPPEKFSPPQAEFNAKGAYYHFWVFDTDRWEPVFWNVHIAPDGTTSYSDQKLS